MNHRNPVRKDRRTLGVEEGNRRSATRRENGAGRLGNKIGSQRGADFKKYRRHGRDGDGGGSHLSVGKQGDGACMPGLARIFMEISMQGWRSGQQIEQQYEQNGERREWSASPFQYSGNVSPQTEWNLARGIGKTSRIQFNCRRERPLYKFSP